MRKIISIFLLIFIITTLVGCSINTQNENITENISITEKYEGKVTYYSSVKGDEENRLLIIDTNAGSTTFTVLPSSEILGNDDIAVGDNVKIECQKEIGDSTYRIATKIEIVKK